MALYVYIKAPPKDQSRILKKKTTVVTLKVLPYLSIISGVTLLLLVILPMISYQLLIFSKKQSKLIAPISEKSIAEARGFISPKNSSVKPSVLSAKDEETKPEFTQEVDYNLIENWFPTAPLPRVKPSKITHYTLSIPKLKIKEATVTIGKGKVKETLIHYPGTALPGEYGNTVIFGHSILPMFYNPKNYKAIFSLLPTLEKGDKIYIYFDGIEYIYEVEDYFEVKPENIQVLEQHFNEQVLSLITCTPPGTYIRRGVIKARLKAI